jgi:phosphonate transport system ATP-binding protein
MRITAEGLEARPLAAHARAAPALRGVSLRVEAGEQLAVIGPSGAGKTTLMHALACALRPGAGALRLDGADPWHLRPRDLRTMRGRLFLAPQVPPLPPRQRVVTALLAARLPMMSLAASLAQLVHPTDLGAAYAALAQFDLENKLFDRVDRLSGGERQRVGLARALLSPARLWLIDEPLSALDPARARQALATLCDQARARGTTLVATLHQVDMALAHFARIVGLREGTIVFDLPADQVDATRLDALYAGEVAPPEATPAPGTSHVADEDLVPGPPPPLVCR